MRSELLAISLTTSRATDGVALAAVLASVTRKEVPVEMFVAVLDIVGVFGADRMRNRPAKSAWWSRS